MRSVEFLKALFVTSVCIGILVVNPLTLLGISRSASLQKDLLTPIIYSVFVSDCVQGVFLGGISVILSWLDLTQPPMWLIRVHTLYLVGIVANIMSVVMLSFWQTLGIIKPMTFQSLLTRRKVLAGLILTWIWAAVMAILYASSDDVFYDVITRYVDCYHLTYVLSCKNTKL